MKTLKFDGMEVAISDEELQQEVFDIDFGGHIKVQFTKQKDGNYKPTNAMNGWGDNCFSEIEGKDVVIKEENMCLHNEGSHYCYINRAAKCNKCGAVGWLI